MKKILSTILIFSLSYLGINSLTKDNKAIELKATDYQVSYNASFSNGLPGNWELYENCDTKHTSLTKGENAITIEHNNSSITQSQYYGTLYTINPFDKNVTDFTMEMSFKYNSYADESRWIALMYHTQINNKGMLSGYDMNFRVNGRSAQSTVTNTPIFTDSMDKQTSVKGSDKQFHTMKIVADGKNVSHYMDNLLVTSYNIEDYSNLLGMTQTFGNFALIVNRSSITINSFAISGNLTNQTRPIEDDDLASIYKATSNVIGQFSINSFIDTKHELDSLVPVSDLNVNTPRVDNAIFYVNKEMGITDSIGNSLDAKLDNVYKNYLKGFIIPVIYLKDETIANSFVNYYRSNLNIIDMAIMSDNPSIIKTVKESIPVIRAIIDYTNTKVDSYYDLVSITNANYAQIAMINESIASKELIDFVQARFKTIWVNNLSYNSFDVIKEVGFGAYGIVTDCYLNAYEDVKIYERILNNDYNMNRIYRNIAHRGLCLTNYENSLEGFIEAYQKGADAIELDLQMTSDGVLVVMHDDTINRTTNGVGNVSSYTAKELEKYKIIKNYDGAIMGDGVAIPTLEQVFEQFKDTDLQYIIEIKTGNANACNKLKVLLDKYNAYDKSVIISFYQSQLKIAKDVIPEVPTADLNAYSYDSFASSGLSLLGSMNTTIDNNQGYLSKGFTTDLAIRGFSNYAWTYSKQDDIRQAGIEKGVLGVTNNSADSIAKDAQYLVYNDNYVINYEGDSLLEAYAYFDFISFDGTTSQVAAGPVAYEDHGDYAYAIYYATYQNDKGYSYNLFSDVVTIVKESAFVEPSTIISISNKKIEDLSLEEKEILERFNTIYEYYVQSDRKLIDLEKINSLLSQMGQDPIEDISEIISEPENKEPSSSKGCKGLASSSICGLIALASYLTIKRKLKK